MIHKATYNGMSGQYCTVSGRVKFGTKVFYSIEDAIKFFGK